MSGGLALVSCALVIALLWLALHRLAGPHRRMYAEIYARDLADVQARTALRAAAYDRQSPVLRPSVDGPTAGAGTPDPAPAVDRRVRVELGGPHRHRRAA